jgi:transcriptional regulator with GAF, ATPase, and Fis domain
LHLQIKQSLAQCFNPLFCPRYYLKVDQTIRLRLRCSALAIERAVVLTQGPDLEVSISELKSVAPTAQANISTLEAAEREHIMRALEEANWVGGGTNGAAARLGMKRTTLQSRMQKLGLERGKS